MTAVVPAVPYKGITYWLEAQTLLKGLHFIVVVGVRQIMCFLVDVGDALACPLMVRGRNVYLKLVLWTTQLSSLLKVVFKEG